MVSKMFWASLPVAPHALGVRLGSRSWGSPLVLDVRRFDHANLDATVRTRRRSVSGDQSPHAPTVAWCRGTRRPRRSVSRRR